MADNFRIYMAIGTGNGSDSVYAWWQNCMGEKGWLFVHSGPVNAPTLAEMVETALMQRGWNRVRGNPHLELLNGAIEGAPNDSEYGEIQTGVFRDLNFYLTGRQDG